MKRYYPVLSEYIIYTKVEKSVNLASYLTGVERGNTAYDFEKDAGYLAISKSEIVIKHEVDYSKPGVYPVEYSFGYSL